MAAALNTASNVLNQVYDLEIDRVNKPTRPLCTGEVSVGQAAWFSALFYALSLGLAWMVNPAGARHACFILVVIAAVMTYLYSAPPVRTKRFGVAANITIAIPRGMLLKMAGWSTVRPIVGGEPWYIGMIFGIFLLGATTTKDFADIKGDARSGCMTLPVKYGVRTAAWMTCPFFVFPFLLIPLGAELGVLTGNRVALDVLGIALALWGIYVARLMLREPERLAAVENHPSWVHMYSMMFVLQIGFAAAYWI
jgi:4-hydroxybenzoate polyprenyltransferase